MHVYIHKDKPSLEGPYSIPCLDTGNAEGVAAVKFSEWLLSLGGLPT